jgi:radical SAM superfamily enzyme YgiQ (UPF0313 family)
MKTSLLFLHPTFFFQESYHKDLFNSEIPLKTLQTSALLQKRGDISTDFLDLRYEKEISSLSSKKTLNLFEFKEKIIKLFEHIELTRFKTVAFFIDSSYQYLQTKIISEVIREEFPEISLLICTPHSFGNKNEFVNEYSNFDIIIIGEPESVINNHLSLHLLRKSKYKKTPILLKSPNNIDLDLLPFPDYDTYLSKYNSKNTFNFTIHISRGCPFNCSFCKIMRSKFRNFSYKKFMKRFERLQKIVLNYNENLPKIGFIDQSFNSALLSNKILRNIIKNKLYESFKFSCQTRIEIVAKHPDLLKLIKKARMVVGYGFETANKRLLHEMKKTNNPSNYIRDTIKILEFYKEINEPYCRINTLSGFPGENIKTFQQTIDFLEKNAFHKNIQIGPSLFINDPITSVYNNMAHYEKKYGTKFSKKWWTIQSDPLKKSVLPKPSKYYSKRQLVSDYKNKYIPLLTKFKFKTFRPLINWKKFFTEWEKELESEK